MHIKCCKRWVPYHDMLYCPACQKAKCEYCIDWDPVIWFCQHCLVEYTKTGASSNMNKCNRNCVLCPLCSSLVIQSNDDRLTYNCVLCDYSFTFKDLTTYGSLCTQSTEIYDQKIADLQHFLSESINEKSQNTHIYEYNNALAPPKCMPLRAKFNKKCRDCGFCLIEVAKHVKNIAYGANYSASNTLPRLELYRTKGNALILVVWAKNDAYLELSSQSKHLKINVIQTMDNVVFPYPLSLVVRESIASRQSFMQGNNNIISGPGWTLATIGDDQVSEDWIYLFNGKKYEAKLPIYSL